MKFLSIDNAILAITALVMANMIASDQFWMRYFGIAVAVYGLLVINRRIMDLTEKLKDKDNG